MTAIEGRQPVQLTLTRLLTSSKDLPHEQRRFTLWRFLTVFAEQDRPDIARRRAWWRRIRRRSMPARLVFIVLEARLRHAETWAKTNMARTHGWWRRAAPLRARVPQGHWRTMTVLAALRQDRITPARSTRFRDAIARRPALTAMLL